LVADRIGIDFAVKGLPRPDPVTQELKGELRRRPFRSEFQVVYEVSRKMERYEGDSQQERWNQEQENGAILLGTPNGEVTTKNSTDSYRQGEQEGD
jgi:hypothetical protein